MFRRKRNASDFSAEIEAHIELETARLQEQGLSYEQARTAARRTFGNVTISRERFYESGRWLGWDHFWHDIRYGARMLRKVSGLHRHRHSDDCAGHRRDHRDFQRRGCHAAASASLPATRATREHRGRSSRRGRAGRGDVRSRIARFSALRNFRIRFDYRRRRRESHGLVAARAHHFSERQSELFCAAGREAAVGPLFRSRGSDARIYSGGAPQRRPVEAGFRGRSGNSGKKFAARQRFVSRDRRHAARLSRSGTNSGGTERRIVAGVGICRPACAAADAQRAASFRHPSRESSPD